MSNNSLKRLSRITATWLSVSVLCQPFELCFYPFLVIWLKVLWLTGGVLVLILLFSLLKKGDRLLKFILLLMTLSPLNLFYFYGERLSALTFFFFHKSQYEAVMASVNTALTCTPNETNLTGWRIECQPKRQVVFLLPGAKSYSWQGIVYSPAGGEGVSAGFNKFGSYLYSKEHLYGDWYLCTFIS